MGKIKSTKEKDRYLELFLTVLMAFILSLPILSYLVNRSVGHMQELVFVYGFYISAGICTVLVAIKFILFLSEHNNLSFWDKLKSATKNNLDYLLFFLYIVWIFISTCYNGFTQVNVFGLSFKREGLITFTLYVFIFFAASFIKKKGYKTFLAAVFALGAIVLAILGVYVNISANPQETSAIVMYNKDIGVFLNYNHHGYYLAMTGSLMLALAVFLKKLWWRIIFSVGFIITYIYILFLTSIGALVSIEMGMILVCVIFAVVNNGMKYKVLAAAGAVLTIAMFFIVTKTETPISAKADVFVDQTSKVALGQAEDGFGTNRILLWKTTFGYIKEKPVFGWGSDGIWYMLGEASGEAQRTHNEYLQQTAFFGIPAGLCYTLGCFMVYWRALRNRRTLRACDIVFLSGGFAYLVGAFFGVTMIQVYPMFMAVLGLSMTENEAKPEEKR
ncbi:MAG: O-antigen ligase family protein [Eubacterium sp.]|jgi:putative inorganic carbon (HCO3(-)) transporter|nr:O-antigen ligase family protein [Eubacterium sp.]